MTKKFHPAPPPEFRIVADIDPRHPGAEALVPGPGGKSIRLYTTTLPTAHRLTTLMHNPQYRLSIAWQNVVYNKPAHTRYFLGHGMKPPARAAIRLTGPTPPSASANVSRLSQPGRESDRDSRNTF